MKSWWALLVILGLSLSCSSLKKKEDEPCDAKKYFDYRMRYRSRYDSTKADLTLYFVNEDKTPMYTPNLVVRVFPFYPAQRRGGRFYQPKEQGLQRRIFTQKGGPHIFEFDLSNDLGKKPDAFSVIILQNREFEPFQTDTIYFDNLKKVDFTLVGKDPCKGRRKAAK